MAIIGIEKVARGGESRVRPRRAAAAGRKAKPAGPSTTLVEGIPLDLAFYAGRIYPKLGKAEAIKKVMSEMKAQDKEPRHESVGAPESVVSGNLVSYPSLYADPGTIAPDERIPAEWLPILKERLTVVDTVLRSVGRVQIQSFVPSPATKLRALGYEVGLIIGTAFVVAEGIAMTNSHVAKEFARAGDGEFPFLKDLRASYEPEILIDFAGVYARAPELYRVSKVLYLAPENELDVALLKLEPLSDGSLPAPLPLQTERPADAAPTRRVFVCGYPTQDDDPRVPYMFRMLRVKRVSLGQFLGEEPYNGKEWLFHNCTTLGGSSGSPVVDFETGTVWGLHASGQVRSLSSEGNLAEPMWKICKLKAVADVLNGATRVAPVALAPLAAAAGDDGQTSRSSVRITRPVSFICKGDISATDQFHPEWFAPDSDAHGIVKSTVGSVGQIRLKQGRGASSSGDSLGTGFMIAEGILITMANPSIAWELKKERPGLTVEFASTVCDEPSHAFRVSEVLLNALEGAHVALLRLENRRNRRPPPPLALQKTRPTEPLFGHKVFVVGHPFQDTRAPDQEILTLVFPPPYGVKRVGPGLVMKTKPRGQLAHDCSTSLGDGGAPLASLATGKVLGIHVGGDHMQHNYGWQMWTVLASPKVRKLLGKKLGLKPPR